jgi:twinkle protein
MTTHLSCDECGSSDALTDYEDGAYCFSCKTKFTSDGTINVKAPSSPSVALKDHPGVKCQGIPDRRISEAVCSFYGIRSTIVNGREIQRHYPVYKKGSLTGYKTRTLPKDFSKDHRGDTKGPIQLFGQHLFNSGPVILVTAGEEDAMAAHEITKFKSKTGRGYPAVSLPNGCNIKALKENLQWFSGFDKIILCLDQEEDKDLKDAEEFSRIFPPGKCFIARFSENDVSDMCRSGKFSEFYSSLFQAKPFKPAGIIRCSDTWGEWLRRDEYESVVFPRGWGLEPYGDILRLGSLITLGAGTGVGKTTLFKELEYQVFSQSDYNVGIIHLEEPVCDTVGGLLSIHMEARLGDKDCKIPMADQRKAWEEVFASDRFVLDQAFGHLEPDGLLDKIRYMAHAGGCKFIFIDHLSALTSLYGSDRGGSKIEKTEQLVTSLQMLTQELSICIVMAAHVRKRDDKSTSYENGAIANLDSLSGSASIKNYSDAVMVIQRDQRVPDSPLVLHVIKNRLTGKLGPSNKLTFNSEKCRIQEYKEVAVGGDLL